MNRTHEEFFSRKMVSLARMFERYSKRFYQTPDAENDPSITRMVDNYLRIADKLGDAFEKAGYDPYTDWNALMEKSGARKIIDDTFEKHGTEPDLLPKTP